MTVMATAPRCLVIVSGYDRRMSREGLLFIIIAGCGDARQLDAELSLEVSEHGSAVAQRDRVAELEAWVLANHDRQGHGIVLTETLEDGTVVDWVDRATTRGAHVQIPPLPNFGHPKGVEPSPLQELNGPPNALPFCSASVHYVRQWRVPGTRH